MSSATFQLDPESDEARRLIQTKLGLSPQQHGQLVEYAALVVEWNERINLVSRKDCNLQVVFGRHVLPCLAPVALKESGIQYGSQVIDIGTGGGLPGIPLAIAYPDAEFLLVDSVGKKLTAVDDMIERIGLTNVQTKHARAEDIQERTFDYCVGRSVASLSRFCGWMSHLLKPETGKLMYIIGGDVPESCLAEYDEEIHCLIVAEDDHDENLSLISDKRLLVFPQKAVQQMGKNAGGPGSHQVGNQHQQPKIERGNKLGWKKKARGAWNTKSDNAPKQRGYENFQRYDSR